MKTTFLPKALFALFVLGAALTSCDKDVFDPSDNSAGVYKSAEYAPIAEYLETQPQFSEYTRALRYSGTFNALNQSTKDSIFTVFVPNNEAMQEFYQRRGVSSLEELTPEYVRKFVFYHTVAGDSLRVEDFVKKPNVTNIELEVLNVWIDPDHAGHATLGDEGEIIEMGLPASNGKIYVLSKVLTPLVETITDRVKDLGNSSIMCQALEQTGWMKELSIVADTTINEGKRSIRKRFFTLLNVTDDVFAADGIHSLADLQARLNAADDRGVTPDSLMREYVAYHIMRGSYTLADIAGEVEEGATFSRLLGSNARSQLMSLDYDGSVLVPESRFTFNAQGNSASFVPGSCDINGKNGYVHNLSSWLPVWQPSISEVVWDLADYVEVKAAAAAANMTYAPSVAADKEYKVSFSTKDTSVYTCEIGENGKGSTAYGEGVTYVTPKALAARPTYDAELYSNVGYRNDFIVVNVGFMGSVKIETPVLVKGKYRVELHYYYSTDLSNVKNQKNGSNGGLMSISFDGRDDTRIFLSPYRQIPYIVAGFYHTTIYDELSFDETGTHEFKLTCMDPYANNNKFFLAFDYIRFTPID